MMGMNMMHSHTHAPREHMHMHADKHSEDRMGHSEMMMHMPRWFTLKTDVHFMVEHLRINSVTGIALAMCVTVVLVVIFDAINFTFNLKHCRKGTDRGKESLVSHGAHALLKMLSVFVGYIVMLCVMSYNVWLLVSAVLGAGVAHFILRPFLYSRLQSNPCNSDDAPVTNGTTRELLYDDVIANEETSPLNGGTCTSCCIENRFPLTDVSPLV